MCGDVWLSQDSEDASEILAPYCRRYGCEDCTPILRRLLRQRIQAGRPNKLLTLTLRRVEGADPIEAAAFLMKSWDTLLKRIRRYHGDSPVEYIHVKEGTRKGWPHLHVAMRMKSIDVQLLKAWWEEITGAYEVDIRAVRSWRGVARYLAKYLTKDLVKFGSYRVWSSSRHWIVDKDEEPAREPVGDAGEWWRGEGFPQSHLKMLVRAGYYIVTMAARHWKAYKPHDWPEYAYRERYERQEKAVTCTGKIA